MHSAAPRPYSIASIALRFGFTLSAQRLLARTDLTGKTAVMDALNTQQETARQVVQDCGGDYVLTVKGNQKGLSETLEQLWNGAHSAFSPSALDVGFGPTRGTE